MSVRITIDFMEMKIGDGSKWLISLFHHPSEFYLQFETRGDLREWFDNYCEENFQTNNYCIAFPTNPAGSQGMQERLQERFGSTIKIERISDLSNLSKEGREWGCQNPLRFAKAKPIHKPPYADRTDQSHHN